MVLPGQFHAEFSPAGSESPHAAPFQRCLQHLSRFLRTIDDQHAALAVQSVALRVVRCNRTSLSRPRGQKIALLAEDRNGSLPLVGKWARNDRRTGVLRASAYPASQRRTFDMRAVLGVLSGTFAAPRAVGHRTIAAGGLLKESLTCLDATSCDFPPPARISAIYANATSRQNTASLGTNSDQPKDPVGRAS